jgi:hypothetical protein
MDIINFSIDNFPSLIEREDWTGQWNSVDSATLAPDETQILADFEVQLGDPMEELPDDFYKNILLVKCSEEREEGEVVDRLVDKVYGPGIYRTENNVIVLKFGNGFWHVQQDKSTLIVGNMRGSIDFVEKPREIKIKGANGGETKVKVQNCWVTFVSDSQVYEVPINTDPVTNPIKNTILMHCNAGKPLSYFLKMPPTGEGGGGSITNMKDLGAGRFEVTDCYLKDTPKNVDSSHAWVIRLSDGRQVWARGLAEKQLKGGKFTHVFPCLLSVSNLKQVGEKTYLDCVLRNRAEQAPAPSPATPAPKNRRAPGNKPPAQPEHVAEPDYDDIPF